MPALRRDALGVGGLRHRVPDVDVLELRPHLEVGVRDVEQAARRDRSEPRIVEGDRGAVAVETHHELLAGSHSEVLATFRQVGLRLGDEAVAHRLEVGPVRLVGEELLERGDREAGALDVGEDAPLHVVELRSIGLVQASALPVREHAVVELVRRTDAAALHGLRDAVCAMSEDAIDAT